jgi:hypothetical protein
MNLRYCFCREKAKLTLSRYHPLVELIAGKRRLPPHALTSLVAVGLALERIDSLVAVRAPEISLEVREGGGEFLFTPVAPARDISLVP